MGRQTRGLDFHSIGAEHGFQNLMSLIPRWPSLGPVAGILHCIDAPCVPHFFVTHSNDLDL